MECDEKKQPPWEAYPHIWKTEAAFMSWVRGGIRRSLWKNHPVKLEFIKKNRIRIPNPNPRGKVSEVWGAVCALTGDVVTLSNAEVDHVHGNHSLKTFSDIGNFIHNIAFITEKDLQFVSTEAHRIKSYAEKQGISFEEAKAVKDAIKIEEKGVKNVLAFLEEHGYNGPMKNKEQRRAGIVECLMKKGIL